MVLKAPEFRCAAWPPSGSPSPATRPEQAAERLAELSTAAEPGSRLGTKEELRAVCGVSVGTFNEALRLVQARGLVTVRTGRVGGLFASRQSPLVRLGNSVLAINDGATSAADAARIRDALDPLVIQDAIRHRSTSDLEAIRQGLQYMRAAADALDGVEFLRANWALHARIAQVSPIEMLRSLYLGLLEMIAAHTRLAGPADEHPLPEYLECRYRLHADLVSAIDAQDGQRALGVIRTHNATASPPSLLSSGQVRWRL